MQIRINRTEEIFPHLWRKNNRRFKPFNFSPFKSAEKRAPPPPPPVEKLNCYTFFRGVQFGHDFSQRQNIFDTLPFNNGDTAVWAHDTSNTADPLLSIVWVGGIVAEDVMSMSIFHEAEE